MSFGDGLLIAGGLMLLAVLARYLFPLFALITYYGARQKTREACEKYRQEHPEESQPCEYILAGTNPAQAAPEHAEKAAEVPANHAAARANAGY